ncbi:MAG TPA: MFS transporter [Vicinamibacterales bacterium]|nr:MFS transporter [Vicinamibacterales bacterium]
MSQTAIDVDRVLNEGRWTGYQQWLVFLTALTIISDGFDNQLLGVALPTIMREWSVSRAAFAPVVSLGYFGMTIGGTLAGYAGDRIGRRNALLACMALFGVATVSVVAVNDVWTLGLLRLIAGIGLGGAMPNAAALAAEYVPLRQRPFAVTLAVVCVPLGATLAGVAALAALPVVGWRGLFAIGGVTPIVGAAILIWAMPESPRYLVRHPPRWPELAALLRRMGHDVAAEATFVQPADSPVSRPSLGSIFNREFRIDTFALWAAFFSCLLAVYLGFSWLPTILTGAGLGTAIASSGLTAFNLGGVVGALIGGRMFARFGSRVVMVGMTAGAVVCALVMSRMTITATTAVVPILVMLTLTGGLINAVQTTMYALAAHVYPTAIRAGGVGTAVAFGRLGAILVGYAGPWALEYRGSESFFWLMAAALLVTCVSLATVRRHVPAN